MQSVSQIWSFFQVSVIKRRIKLTTRATDETPKHINWMWVQYMHKTVFVCSHFKESRSDESFYLQLQVLRNQVDHKKIPKPIYLITNLAYQLKPHYSRNMYLRPRLDTCADVNIMPASVYHLIFKDPDMKKITLCKMQIGTYMADTVKIVGLAHSMLYTHIVRS